MHTMKLEYQNLKEQITYIILTEICTWMRKRINVLRLIQIIFHSNIQTIMLISLPINQIL